MICCQVPSVSVASTNGIVIDGPKSAARTWLHLVVLGRVTPLSSIFQTLVYNSPSTTTSQSRVGIDARVADANSTGMSRLPRGWSATCIQLSDGHTQGGSDEPSDCRIRGRV